MTEEQREQCGWSRMNEEERSQTWVLPPAEPDCMDPYRPVAFRLNKYIFLLLKHPDETEVHPFFGTHSS